MKGYRKDSKAEFKAAYLVHMGLEVTNQFEGEEATLLRKLIVLCSSYLDEGFDGLTTRSPSLATYDGETKLNNYLASRGLYLSTLENGLCKVMWSSGENIKELESL